MRRTERVPGETSAAERPCAGGGEECEARDEEEEQRRAGAGEDRRDRYAALDDRELVLAMRRDDEEAFVEFVTRFHALLLRHARLARVPVEDQEAVVVEVLGDMAERLTSQSVRIPRSMAGYLVTSLRNRLLNERRSEARRRQLGEAALSEIETHRERAMVDLCSEASLRASRGAAWEPFPTRPALARLAAALDRELSDDERRLVSWLGQHVTQRQIAAWLGISLAATAKRVLRLRTRLRDAADAYIAELDPAEQRELHDFFRRMARGEDR